MNRKKTIYDMNLLDRFLFAEAAKDTEFVELVLSIILDTEITLKDQPQPECEQRKKLDSKQVIMDVMATDTEGTVYDTEVQKVNLNNLPKRMRYYHCMIDANLLPSGEGDYNKLNDVFVIFISPFDLFGKDLYKYTFRMECAEVPGLEIGDGTTTIFLNTHGIKHDGVTEELIELLKYFENTSSQDSVSGSERIRQIQEKIDCIRNDEKMGEEIMFEWEKRIQDKLEGKQEGKQEEKIEIAKVMYEDSFSINKISKYTGLTEDEIKQVCDIAE